MTSFGWNDKIKFDNAGDNKGAGGGLLPEGTYPFEIIDFERGSYPGGQGSIKDPCGVAIYTLRVTDPATGATVEIKDRFYLVDSCKWKIESFFTALGLMDASAPDAAPVPWDQAVGRRGLAKVKINEYTNRRGERVRKNEAQRYYPAENTAAAKAAPACNDIPF